ncbi:uncharacterized protein [Venturia canescens]|uniref:uncharacterized protein n=1 Tax=Venturia canescens TaxID=32260 RepID=UPI001C9BDCF7|nr:uncharacterized protein LOC122413488 [Venturia canescens]
MRYRSWREWNRKEHYLMRSWSWHRVMGDCGDFSQALSQKSIGTLSNYSTEDHPADDAGPSNPKKSRGIVDVVNDKLIAVLDRFKVSDTSAVHLIASVAQSLGFDLNTLIVNRSSIKRKREKLHEMRSMRIKCMFQNTDLRAAVLHWDGKLLPDYESGKKFERLPVLITNSDSEKLLGVPKLENGKGITQANAIHDVLDELGALSSIKALCCDTTASNMGVTNGAAVLLEQMLKKSILYLPCRHHIFEIVLKSVFNAKLKSLSTGPDEPIVKRFKDSWSKIDSTAFRIGIDDKKVQRAL